MGRNCLKTTTFDIGNYYEATNKQHMSTAVMSDRNKKDGKILGYISEARMKAHERRIKQRPPWYDYTAECISLETGKPYTLVIKRVFEDWFVELCERTGTPLPEI